LVVYAGGALSGGLMLEAGSATISGTAAAGQTISFTGPTGDLVLANLGGFAAEIAGMTGTGQEVDLLGFAYNSSTESATWSQGTGSGALTIIDGAQMATLDLIGSYVTSDFTLSNDGHGGTFVVDPPIQTTAGLGPEWHFAGAGDHFGAGTDTFPTQNTANAVTGALATDAAHLALIGGLGPEWNFRG
jgi:hypothetical protein